MRLEETAHDLESLYRSGFDVLGEKNHVKLPAVGLGTRRRDIQLKKVSSRDLSRSHQFCLPRIGFSKSPKDQDGWRLEGRSYTPQGYEHRPPFALEIPFRYRYDVSRGVSALVGGFAKAFQR